MLNRFRSRRLAGLVLLAGLTNVTAVMGAQSPTRTTSAPKSPKSTGTAPRLIADCDVTQSSCGGDPTFGDYFGGGTGDGVAGTPTGTGEDSPDKPAVCWTGTPKKCGEDHTTVCIQYVRNGGGTISITGGTAPGGGVGGSVMGTCIGWTEVWRIYYWSK